MSVERSDGEARFPDGGREAEQPAWRQDFPIDWPQDNYVARRDYAKFLALTSLAFAVGQLWIGVKSLFRRGRGRPPITTVARLDKVPVGGTLTFSYPGPNDPCLLLRPDERTLVAYGQKCTHLSCAVIPDPDRGVIRCPCHEGLFELSSGRPIAGPPPRPLPRVVLEVRGGDVYATGIEERTV